MKHWVVALLIVSAQDTFAQIHRADSLLAVLNTTRQDTDRLQVLAELASFTREQTIADTYYPYMQELVERLANAKDPATRAVARRARTRSLIWAARLRIRATDYPSAVHYLDEAGRMATELRDTTGLLWYASEMSDVYMMLKDTTGAMRFGYRSAELALLMGDSSAGFERLLSTSAMDTSKRKMQAVLDLGDAYFTTDRAMREYYLWSRAWTLIAHGEYDQAIADLLLSDSLLTVRDAAFRGMVHLMLGEAYRLSRRSEQAITALRAGIALAEFHNNPGVHASCARALGDIEYDLGNHAEAEAAWRTAVEQGHLGALPEEEIPALNGLRRLYTQQGRFEEALTITRSWLVLRDSMARMDATKDILYAEFNAMRLADSLEHIFQTQQEAVRTEQRMDTERSNRNLALGIGAVLLLGLIGIWQRARLLRRTNRAILDAQSRLLESERAREASEVRARIARDVHDQLGSDLTKLAMLSSEAKAAARNTPNDLSPIADDIERVAGEANRSLGDIVWAIDPHHDSLAGLTERVRAHCERMLKWSSVEHSLDCVHTGPDRSLDPATKRDIYLMLREALNNAIKYAKAKHIQVHFHTTMEHVEFEVKDDGVGLGTEQRAGHGTANMKARAQRLGAEFSIDSQPGAGVQIRFRSKLPAI